MRHVSWRAGAALAATVLFLPAFQVSASAASTTWTVKEGEHAAAVAFSGLRTPIVWEPLIIDSSWVAGTLPGWSQFSLVAFPGGVGVTWYVEPNDAPLGVCVGAAKVKELVRVVVGPQAAFWEEISTGALSGTNAYSPACRPSAGTEHFGKFGSWLVATSVRPVASGGTAVIVDLKTAE